MLKRSAAMHFLFESSKAEASIQRMPRSESKRTVAFRLTEAMIVFSLYVFLHPPPPLFEIMFRIKYLPGRQSDRKRRRKNATVRIPVFTHARLGRNLKRVRTKFVNAIACSFWSLEYEHVDRPPPAASARDNKPANGFCSRNRV